jgi:putative transposase
LLKRSSPSSLSDAGRSTPRESPLDKQKGVQGSQFASVAFTGVLLNHGVSISMDGKGSWRDNVFVERLWRSVKYEEVYLKAYDSVRGAQLDRSLSGLLNHRRPHSSLDRRTPDEAYFTPSPLAAVA